MAELLTFHDDEELKKDLMAELERHRELDAFVQGKYGEGQGDSFRGCAVGCAIDSLNRIRGESYGYGDHSAYKEGFGIPMWFALLEDGIFEGLPLKEAKQFPLSLMGAIPVGVELEPVKWGFGVYVMGRNATRVASLEIPGELKDQVTGAIGMVTAVHHGALETGEWDESAARSAAEPARSTARSAARSAEYGEFAGKLIELVKASGDENPRERILEVATGR